jgi:HlyD family secretion protein
MKKRLIVIAALLLAGLGTFLVFREMGTRPAKRILISGNIELTEVNLAFKTPGRLVERSVDEGDSLKKGQVVARIENDQLQGQHAAQEAVLAGAKTQLAQAESALEWQRQTLPAELAQRSADLASAEARLAELRNGARPQEKLDARAAVDSAQSELERARRDWDRAQTLYKNDDISTAQYDQYRNRFEGAQALLRQVSEREGLVLAGPRTEVIAFQAAVVDRARAVLKMSQANVLEVKRREQELATRRAEIDRAQANLAVIESQLRDTIISAPVDGVVLVKAADVGEVLGAATTVVTVGDIEHPWLRGYIDESELGRVKLGAKARITTDSFPNKSYDGHISFISSEAEFTPKQIQTQRERVKLVYRIKIAVDNPAHELKSNMPADAEIILD